MIISWNSSTTVGLVERDSKGRILLVVINHLKLSDTSERFLGESRVNRALP